MVGLEITPLEVYILYIVAGIHRLWDCGDSLVASNNSVYIEGEAHQLWVDLSFRH